MNSNNLSVIASSLGEAESVLSVTAQRLLLPFRAGQRVRRQLAGARNVALTAGAVVPALAGFLPGLDFPDLDIPTLGIGHHRFFAFHSALAPLLLQKAYHRYIAPVDETPGLASRALGVALGAFAAGVGVHLLIDGVFQPGKAVLFPVLGSLVEGTRVDDRLWLIGNSLWCFRIAHNLIVFATSSAPAGLQDARQDRFDPILTHGFPSELQ